jgi:hypothetical protein
MINSSYIFNRTAKFYITAHIGGDTLKRIKKRLKYFKEKLKLLNTTIDFIHPPHITLLQFDINMDSNFYYFLIKILQNKYILDKNLVMNFLSKILFKSEKGKYNIFNTYIAREYKVNDKNLITAFRKNFYHILNYNYYKYKKKNIIKKNNKIINNNVKYTCYKDNHNKLYAVPEWYYGKGIWRPHLSLFNIHSVQPNFTNPNKLLNIFKKSVNTLENKLLSISKIPGYDIKNIDFSLSILPKFKNSHKDIKHFKEIKYSNGKIKQYTLIKTIYN